MNPLREVPDEFSTQRWLQAMDRSLLGIVEALQMIGKQLTQLEVEGTARLDQLEAKLDQLLKTVEDLE